MKKRNAMLKTRVEKWKKEVEVEKGKQERQESFSYEKADVDPEVFKRRHERNLELTKKKQQQIKQM